MFPKRSLEPVQLNLRKSNPNPNPNLNPTLDLGLGLGLELGLELGLGLGLGSAFRRFDSTGSRLLSENAILGILSSHDH